MINESGSWYITQDNSLPRPPQKTLKHWHNVSSDDARSISMAQRISLDDPLPGPPVKTLKSWHGILGRRVDPKYGVVFSTA